MLPQQAISFITQIVNDHINTLTPAAKQATGEKAQQAINIIEHEMFAQPETSTTETGEET